VKNINIKEGYFPENASVFIKADNTTAGIKVTDTDLHNRKEAIEVAAKQ
jgi:hypothetical protein